jgi:hypothetical protein
MSITVATRLVQGAGALSALGQQALAFIDGGTEWLAWALAATTRRYDFADETELLAEVQQGLHGSPYTLLPQLQLLVSPVKLMTLGLPALRTLAQAEGGDTSEVVAAQVRRLLADHGLLARADLAAGTAWLRELGVADAPVLQAMDLHGHLAIQALMHRPPGGPLQGQPQGAEVPPALLREAAAFGAQQGRTPQEFGDYYRVYVDQTVNTDLLFASAQEREAAAGAALATLLPLLFGTLDCPQLGGLAAPQEIARTVGNWLAAGRRVGFARLSQAVQQVVRHSAWRNETGDAARRILDRYLQSAQAFLSQTPARQGRMAQDGATCRFALENGEQYGELQVDRHGVVSLAAFGRRRPAGGDPSAAGSAPARPAGHTLQPQSETST